MKYYSIHRSPRTEIYSIVFVGMVEYHWLRLKRWPMRPIIPRMPVRGLLITCGIKVSADAITTVLYGGWIEHILNWQSNETRTRKEIIKRDKPRLWTRWYGSFSPKTILLAVIHNLRCYHKMILSRRAMQNYVRSIEIKQRISNDHKYSPIMKKYHPS